MTFKTTDLCDANEGKLWIADPIFRAYGGKAVFAGEIVTVKVFEDNVLVREVLSQTGNDRVLVVDGGGSLRCALVGGLMAQLAEKNGWSGLVVFGCIRDVNEINERMLGVRALNTHPLKSSKRGHGECNIPVTFAGVSFAPGYYVYADEDGMVVSATSLHP